MMICSLNSDGFSSVLWVLLFYVEVVPFVGSLEFDHLLLALLGFFPNFVGSKMWRLFAFIRILVMRVLIDLCLPL